MDTSSPSGSANQPGVSAMEGTSQESCQHSFEESDENSSEDADQHSLLTVPRDTLKSLTDKYKLSRMVGKGSYGYVYKGKALESRRRVAVKIFRSSEHELLAEREFETCLLFSGLNCFVEILDIFTYNELPCLVFEYLHKDLLKYLSKKGALSINQVRPLLRQLLDALKLMQEVDFVHGDLKPSNIMIENKRSPELHLKIVDLGSSRPITEDMDTENFQTIHFRSPEVIIQAPCSGKVDMWSLGCVLAEMLMGRRIYPGKTPRDQIIMITKCQGELPQSVLSKGRKVLKYYDHSEASGYKLKETEGGLTPKSWISNVSYYSFNMNSLDDVVEVDETASHERRQLCLHLLKFMLNTDSEQRCSPQEALDHDFFTGP